MKTFRVKKLPDPNFYSLRGYLMVRPLASGSDLIVNGGLLAFSSALYKVDRNWNIFKHNDFH